MTSTGWAIALHGGAGDIPRSMPPERRQLLEAALRHSLQIGVNALKANQSTLDVVELVVRTLEDNPNFNAGKGSDLASNGSAEMEACIMDGNTMKCGAVSGLTTVKNPISLSRLVMDKTPHIYLGFNGAEAFAREQGVETVDQSYFVTQENIDKLKQAQASTQEVKAEALLSSGNGTTGTVGCVAVDSYGNLAAATSTGGCTNKMVGRISASPLVGAGTYANNLCAVSATGNGEAIMRATVAREVGAVMEYKGLSVKEAAEYVIGERVPNLTTGLIAVSATGQVTMTFNTTGMFRACATQDGYTQVGIWPNELSD
ncbi:hypothetical protein BUALT_Bualt02G0161300 [Buddleja alternifolia]|uniref:beta-aspartyl-peptidase n=1 Tax=Buddleja alternifolia TaxID=168488 RepID=A0AAV6YBQ4_9LAMI|nr:hypothetical protein BUALT_Bualt02G0161300 [Buddleja alternifolia]